MFNQILHEKINMPTGLVDVCGIFMYTEEKLQNIN